jgi:hypothetical protein
MWAWPTVGNGNLAVLRPDTYASCFGLRLCRTRLPERIESDIAPLGSIIQPHRYYTTETPRCTGEALCEMEHAKDAGDAEW